MLKNAAGDTVVLNGPSLGWHSNWGRFYNDSTVMAFKQRWGANITRAAIPRVMSSTATTQTRLMP